MLADKTQVFVTLRRVRTSDHLPIRPQPFGQIDVVQTLAFFIPTRWISTAKAKKDFAHRCQRQIVGPHLKIHLNQIKVVEKIEIKMNDMQLDWYLPLAQGQA